MFSATMTNAQMQLEFDRIKRDAQMARGTERSFRGLAESTSHLESEMQGYRQFSTSASNRLQQWRNEGWAWMLKILRHTTALGLIAQSTERTANAAEHGKHETAASKFFDKLDDLGKEAAEPKGKKKV